MDHTQFTLVDLKTGTVTVEGRQAFIDYAETLGHKMTGAKEQRGSIPLNPVIIGQPTFRTLAGPFAGNGGVRYETLDTHERLSV